jgi:hypothetical protein
LKLRKSIRDLKLATVVPFVFAVVGGAFIGLYLLGVTDVSFGAASGQVGVVPGTCVAADRVCQLTLTNFGKGNATALGCYYLVNSQVANGTLSSGKIEIGPGESVGVLCAQDSPPKPGGPVLGFVTLSDGSTLSFSSSWTSFV